MKENHKGLHCIFKDVLELVHQMYMCVAAHTDTWMEMEEEVDTPTLRWHVQQSYRDGSAWYVCVGAQSSNPQCAIVR